MADHYPAPSNPRWWTLCGRRRRMVAGERTVKRMTPKAYLAGGTPFPCENCLRLLISLVGVQAPTLDWRPAHALAEDDAAFRG
jgi:hypothetical protein